MNSHIAPQRAKRLLEEIASLCQEASMTGMLSGGARRVVARYNAVITLLVNDGVLPEGLFTALEDSCSYDEVGVEARLAIASIETPKEKTRSDSPDFGAIMRIAPFVGSKELGELIREQIRAGVHISIDSLTPIAPFLDAETINSLVRDHLSSPRTAPPAPKPTTPEPPAAPVPPVQSNLPVVAPNEELQELAIRLGDPNLTSEERATISIRLSELALQQGQIAGE